MAASIAVTLVISAVLVFVVYRPIAHWRALPDASFPLGGLTRNQWKVVWLVGIPTGMLPLIGAVYWWLWFSRKNQIAKSQLQDDPIPRN